MKSVIAPYRVLLLIFVVTALSLSSWFVFSTGEQRVYAEENEPEAPGSISGVVRNEANEPLEGMLVSLYQKNYYDSSWSPFGQVATDDGGRYRFGLLGAGVFRLGVLDPELNYAQLFYQNAGDVYAAADVVVNGVAQNNVNFTLSSGGEITGVVRAADNSLLQDVSVMLYQRVDNFPLPYGELKEWVYVNSEYLGPEQSAYHFRGLATDQYRLCAASYAYANYGQECYDNVGDLNDAKTLSLTVSTVISNVNFVLGDGADYATLSGHVMSPQGAPLAQIGVYAWPDSAQVYPAAAMLGLSPLVTATNVRVSNNSLALDRKIHKAEGAIAATSTGLSTPAIPYRYYTSTDADGAYTLNNLAADTYQLYFYDPAGHYRYEYYDNVTYLFNAQRITIDKHDRISDANAVLTVGAHLTGTVTVLGQLASNSYLTLYKYEEENWRVVMYTTTDLYSGSYDFGGLPAGRYRVQASASIVYPPSAYYYFYGMYGGTDWETAKDIKLVEGMVQPNIDINLNNGPQFNGEISGHVTADGVPLPNVQVNLYPVYSGYPFMPDTPQTYTVTDDDGRYTIKGLTATSYQMRFDDRSGRRAALFYPQQPLPNESQFVSTTDITPTIGIDIDLPAAGAIAGRVYQQNGEALVGTPVMAILQNQQQATFFYRETVTAADGSYHLQGLYPGAYHVCAGPKLGILSGYGGIECFGDSSSSPWFLYGRTMSVVAGEATNNIDILWGTEHEQYLPVVTR